MHWKLTCLTSFFRTPASFSGSKVCLRKASRTDTMMLVSRHSRKQMKKTGPMCEDVEARNSGQVVRDAHLGQQKRRPCSGQYLNDWCFQSICCYESAAGGPPFIRRHNGLLLNIGDAGHYAGIANPAIELRSLVSACHHLFASKAIL